MRFLKWTGILLGVVAAILVVAGIVLYAVGGSRLGARVDLPPETITTTTDSMTVARGEHIALTHACISCHGEALEGRMMADAPPFRLVAPNLTSGRGGVGSRLDAPGWERAIRHGIGDDGHGLIVMPSELYVHLADDDLAALVDYLSTLPAVDNELPTTEVRPLGRLIAAFGGIAPASTMIDHTTPHPPRSPEPAATLEYGRYRGGILCTACHGADLNGAPPLDPEGPPGPSLRVAATWTSDQFRTAMRTGVTPFRELNDEFMPWTSFRHFTDEEIEALFLFVRSF
jgi:mono/diheme cytochrome c family protein